MTRMRMSPPVLAALLLAATFLFSVVKPTCDLREYGTPHPIKEKDISDEFYREIVDFALTEKNKERSDEPHRMKLVSIDEGVYYPSSDFNSFYRFNITTSNHYDGQAKYSIFVIDSYPVTDIYTLKCFERI
ncbi:unnamed protein product [Linum trigynum]|uniref:Uncharacterized protein n=1 Tax=Linum trigynum TaxID=586398 RepID=A0AAV2EHU7_9ROSI